MDHDSQQHCHRQATIQQETSLQHYATAFSAPECLYQTLQGGHTACVMKSLSPGVSRSSRSHSSHQCWLDFPIPGEDITDLGKRVCWCQQYIFWFQVTVHDVLEVKVSQSHQDLRKRRWGQWERQKGLGPMSTRSPSTHQNQSTPFSIPLRMPPGSEEALGTLRNFRSHSHWCPRAKSWTQNSRKAGLAWRAWEKSKTLWWVVNPSEVLIEQGLSRRFCSCSICF
jgi:hypothetical protein